MTTTENITNKQIRTLSDEAQAAGDYCQVDICSIALAEHDSCNSNGEPLLGPDGRPMTREEARAICAAAISDGSECYSPVTE